MGGVSCGVSGERSEIARMGKAAYKNAEREIGRSHRARTDLPTTWRTAESMAW